MGILMAQREPEQTITATIAAPTPAPPIPTDFVQRDWGMAIGISVLVLMNLWQVVKSQLNADDALQKELIKGLLEQNRILLQAVLERKTGS
jgi:hypothetical protein